MLEHIKKSIKLILAIIRNTFYTIKNFQLQLQNNQSHDITNLIYLYTPEFLKVAYK